MKEPKYPHFFLHFLLEKLLVGKSDTEKVVLSLSEISASFSAYSQNYPNQFLLPDELYFDTSAYSLNYFEYKVKLHEVQNVLEGFLKLKPVSKGQDPSYELTQSIVPDEFVVPYSIRRAAERLSEMNKSSESGMLVAPAGGCKSCFAAIYQSEYPRMFRESERVHIMLVPGSTPAQLYYQLLEALSPEEIPVRDEKGLYTPTEDNL